MNQESIELAKKHGYEVWPVESGDKYFKRNINSHSCVVVGDFNELTSNPNEEVWGFCLMVWTEDDPLTPAELVDKYDNYDLEGVLNAVEYVLKSLRGEE